MDDPIRFLEELNARRPEVFKALRAANGYDVPGIGYQELMDLQVESVEDTEFAETLGLASEAITRMMNESSPHFRAWLEEHGLISKRLLDMGKRLDELVELLEDGAPTPEEVKGAVAELRGIRDEALKSADTSKARRSGTDAEAGEA